MTSTIDLARDDEPPIATWRSAAKDIFIGSIAGMISEVFEYPFDLAKVRLQAQLLGPPSNLRFSGPLDCLNQTWREEGVRGLYRGLPVPIAGTMAETAVLFFAYSSFQNAIRRFTPSTSEETLSIPQLALAGAGAGLVASFILTPIELIKCKLQVQMIPPSTATVTAASIPALVRPSLLHGISLPLATKQSHNLSTARAASHMATSPPGALALARTTFQTYGMSGLWRGHTGTVLRETGGTAAWFAVKEAVAGALIRYRLGHTLPTNASASTVPVRPRPGIGVAGGAVPEFTSSAHSKRIDVDNSILPWESAVSGAIAGAVSVIAIYPADTIKSAMQAGEEIKEKGSPSQANLTHASNARAANNGRASLLGSSPAQATFLTTLRRMYAAHGLRGLYAGCGMTVAKAIPSSGIMFVVYDGLTKVIG
ncbi:hypothetical protein HGRIS_000333 [Hohenbuehelia grisea]|uniref:Mitochondrial carrier n=1 Tax=Hohenbuehelia grisea TaxID=104357 RepID=A0ABR3JRX7_9AGAR